MESLPTLSPATSLQNVLVVEDNDTTRQRIAAALQRRGYNVSEATDGLDALRKVTAARFNAIVLDLIMPHVDGWQFRSTQMRHPELARIPTVIVTVQPLREPARYALRSEDIVHKPFDDADLVAAVERACNRTRVSSPATAPEVDGLLWSKRGEIACGTHAPAITSSRWREEGWAAIPAGDGQRRINYRCQHCPGDGSPIDRTRRASR
jgi:CheY-like chemotaxis protein